MVDRSYLPFESARQYQDRRMVKWTGFFLSEHHHALSKTQKIVPLSNSLDDSQKQLYLIQAYCSQVPLLLTIWQKDKVINYLGSISHIDNNSFQIKTKNTYHRFSIHQLISLTKKEES
ncbi:hypothetical protein ACVRY7_10775 [Streptococcus ictaluri]|uniref:YolD-like protein n=1 Tax=Streptococcus ictaluri 707-05 TaxID=764299 RepID=G5K3A7_9STRE|nr:hypothetical protein [Streptococcus ictaluri]EHI69410.1 YolD-like protein [Streptococcus ictaluri 707-05]